MSEENVEIVRSMYATRGSRTGSVDLLDKEVEVDISAVGLLPDRPGRSTAGMTWSSTFRHYWGTWEDYVLEPVEIIDVGEDRVLALL